MEQQTLWQSGGDKPRPYTRWWGIAFTLPVVFTLLLAACGGLGGGTATPVATPTPKQVAEQAAAAMAEVKSAHFVLAVEGQPPPTGFLLQVTRAEGDAAAPDRLKAKISARVGQSPIQTELVVLGNEKFLKNPLSGKFESQALPGTYAFLDKDRGAPLLLRNLQEPTVTVRESVDGTEADVLTGTLNASDLAVLFGDKPAAAPVKTEVWVATSDRLVPRVRLTGPILESDPATIVRTLTLSGYNQDVSIERPT